MLIRNEGDEVGKDEKTGIEVMLDAPPFLDGYNEEIDGGDAFLFVM